MRYISVKWLHDSPDTPILLISEINQYNFETRKVEYFQNGAIGFANQSTGFAGTSLGTVEIPSLEEINSDKQFQGVTISKTEFEQHWQKAFSSSIRVRA